MKTLIDRENKNSALHYNEISKFSTMIKNSW